MPPTQRATSRALAPSVGVALVLALLPGTAHAYLDAGTGSMILQVVIAGITGALITLRLYWARLKARFTGQPLETQKTPADEPGNEPS